MNLVHDDRLNRAQIVAALLRRQQDVERFRRSDQNVRRMLEHGPALCRQRIPGPHRRPDRGTQIPSCHRQFLDLAQRLLEILLYVIAECLERRNVDHRVVGASEPSIAWRISLSMQIRKAARVLPDPVGAEINVGLPERIDGQPSSWGEVGVQNLAVNHSRTTGCAQASAS